MNGDVVVEPSGGWISRDEVALLRDRLREGDIAAGAALDPSEIVAWVRRARGSRKRPSGGWESLTPTERDVACHAADGLTNGEIGARMFIAAGTVKIHLSHTYAKLGVRNRTELAAWSPKPPEEAR
jgi:DNA-binding CsgD family transcriptional regulator